MTIFYFKNSHLNWKTIPYRRRMNCVYCNIFFQHFLNSIFLILVCTQSNFSSAWYDNQISLFVFIFYFFCFFFSCSQDLSASGNEAYHRWLSKLKHHFSCENYFERGCLLIKGLFMSFLSKKGLWLKSVPKKWAIFFLVNMP